MTELIIKVSEEEMDIIKDAGTLVIHLEKYRFLFYTIN